VKKSRGTGVNQDPPDTNEEFPSPSPSSSTTPTSTPAPAPMPLPNTTPSAPPKGNPKMPAVAARASSPIAGPDVHAALVEKGQFQCFLSIYATDIIP
jgi:hypothetical protein